MVPWYPQIIVPFHKGFLGFQTNGPQTNLPHESANFTERSLFLQPWAQPWDQWTTERAHLYPRTGPLWDRSLKWLVKCNVTWQCVIVAIHEVVRCFLCWFTIGILSWESLIYSINSWYRNFALSKKMQDWVLRGSGTHGPENGEASYGWGKISKLNIFQMGWFRPTGNHHHLWLRNCFARAGHPAGKVMKLALWNRLKQYRPQRKVTTAELREYFRMEVGWCGTMCFRYGHGMGWILMACIDWALVHVLWNCWDHAKSKV